MVWFNLPGVVHEVDQYFRDTYLYQPRGRYTRIISDYEKSGDTNVAIAELAALNLSLAEVQKVDDLIAIKQVSYAQLVRMFMRLGELEKARYWTEEWLAWDPKNVGALLSRGRLLLINPETRVEGEFELSVLKHRFPDSLNVANGVATAWASIGELGRAFAEFVPFLPGSGEALVREIGEPVRLSRYRHKAGDPPAAFTEEFDTRESLSLRIETIPENIEVEFKATGMQQIPSGYRKRIGSMGTLELFGFQRDVDFEIKVTATVAPPETLEKLVQPASRQLLLSQLEDRNDKKAIKAYERFSKSS
ncbi:MAG: hypothetical protein HN816_01645 [Gammaproteobacteria bacterium]|nr:hypothetical protein [Gammaproteobacteria bacterium]